MIALLVTLLLIEIAPAPGHAKTVAVETENMPVETVILNLEGKSKGAAADPKIVYALATLHALVYAQSSTTVLVKKADGLPYYGATPTYQPAITNLNSSKTHLQQAFYNYTHAGMAGFDPLLAGLGKAWCVELNDTKPRNAIPLYRIVFNRAWAQEKNITSFRKNGSVALETAQLLIGLLNPTTDAAEIAALNTKTSVLKKRVR